MPGQVTFYLKGADTVMSARIKSNDWVEEECENLGREGLRTLVIGSKVLSNSEYKDFDVKMSAAKLSMVNRASLISSVVETLEHDLAVLAVTGVEDKLQNGVKATLESIRQAGIRVWMITGDKVETASSIARSSRLVGLLCT